MKFFTAAYRKAQAASAAATAVIVVVSADGEITWKEWGLIGVAILGAIGVYRVPNTPKEG